MRVLVIVNPSVALGMTPNRNFYEGPPWLSDALLIL